MRKPENLYDKRRRLATCARRLQTIFTWLTGIAAPGEKRGRPWTPFDYLLNYFATLILAGTAAVYIVQQTLATGYGLPLGIN